MNTIWSLKLKIINEFPHIYFAWVIGVGVTQMLKDLKLMVLCKLIYMNFQRPISLCSLAS